MKHDSKQSAVVVLQDVSTDSLILTRRNVKLRHHPGEICFPGGYRESHDQTLWETALRELNEELGIQPQRVQFIRELALVRTLWGMTIMPWLASIESINPYCLNPWEVTELITIPMKAVLKIENYQQFQLKRHGKIYQSYQFLGCDANVWGATARIMKQLAQSTP